MFDSIKDIADDLLVDNWKHAKRKVSREWKRMFSASNSAQSLQNNNRSDIYGTTGSIVGKY